MGKHHKPGRKVHANAKVKNLPDLDQETLWRLLHPTDRETPAYTLEAVLVHLQEEHGVECALSTLSEWHSWYSLRRRMDSARERAEQTRLELIKDGSFSPEDIERAAQTVFTSEALESGNVKAFVALAKLRLADRALEHDARRIKLLERKAKAADDAAEQMAKLKAGGERMPEAERAAILDKVDEILGVKK